MVEDTGARFYLRTNAARSGRVSASDDGVALGAWGGALMRHTIRALAALAVLAVLGAAVVGGCGGATSGQPASPSPSATPPGAADITGVVRDLTPGAAGAAVLLVAADPDVASSYDRASVRVTAQTTVWAPEGEGRTDLTAVDLAEGQRVAVRFTGPVAESYPVQATAGDVEILTPLE
jgi:hypothetical protein